MSNGAVSRAWASERVSPFASEPMCTPGIIQGPQLYLGLLRTSSCKPWSPGTNGGTTTFKVTTVRTAAIQKSWLGQNRDGNNLLEEVDSNSNVLAALHSGKRNDEPVAELRYSTADQPTSRDPFAIRFRLSSHLLCTFMPSVALHVVEFTFLGGFESLPLRQRFVSKKFSALADRWFMSDFVRDYRLQDQFARATPAAAVRIPRYRLR